MKFVYNSFNGRYSDNPRALHKALVRRGTDHTHTWLANPRHAAAFPPDVPTVQIASDEAVDALEAADVLVANTHTNLDRWTKKPGMTYLQTWHGTPLKRIHRLALQTWGEEIMAALDAEIASWDRLVTPSRAGTDLLRVAFDYRGPVLETGYPRNDLLTAPGAGDQRVRVRRRLGVDEDVTVVLYAPTYRDDALDEGGPTGGLDAPALADALGPDYLVLLRQHYYIDDRDSPTGHDRVRDLSGSVDVADLYLAADVLVTDYSSALFDFAVTGRPILLYTYDLAHYRDRLRGFTLDLEDEAPGPVLHDQSQLAAALLDLPEVVRTSATRYAAFRDRYCHLDDGFATERVIDALWPGPSG